MQLHVVFVIIFYILICLMSSYDMLYVIVIKIVFVFVLVNKMSPKERCKIDVHCSVSFVCLLLCYRDHLVLVVQLPQLR